MRIFLLSSALFSALLALAAPAHAESIEAYSARVEAYCAWAPHNPAVCAGRAHCKTNVRSSQCALYCHVNPYDVVCGEIYRSPIVPNPPAPGESPYPWVHNPSFCQDRPYDWSCRGETW